MFDTIRKDIAKAYTSVSNAIVSVYNQLQPTITAAGKTSVNAWDAAKEGTAAVLAAEHTAIGLAKAVHNQGHPMSSQ